MSTFDNAFALTVGVEGGFTADPLDKGNWTGGALKVGQLKGTKYGISAASYPDLDIANLTLDAAEAIYRRDYWAKVRGDDLPPAVALVLFDSAVNSGTAAAVRWAQAAAGVAVDGVLGPLTLSALQQAAAGKIVAEIMARRLVTLASLPTWATYGLGWARRVQAVMGAAVSLLPSAAIVPAAAPVADATLPPIETIKAAMRAVLAERAAA